MSQEGLGERWGVLATLQMLLPWRSIGQWAIGHHLSAWFRPGKRWLRKRFFTFLPALFVIGITTGSFFYRDKIVEFRDYGYLGAFLAKLASNATIFYLCLVA